MINRLSITTHLRTCRYMNENYLFHCFGQYSYVRSQSILVGGPPAGQISRVIALIEDETGNIKAVEPEMITFTDNEFENYAFPEPKK